MTTGRMLTDLAAVCRRAGVPVIEHAGWQTRARGSGGFAAGHPSGIVVHHTGSNTSRANDAAICATGAQFAPIYQLLIDRTGTVTVLAAGAANHAGAGGPWRGIPQDGANARMLSVSGANGGTGEPWPAVQSSAMVAVCAELCRAYGIPTNMIATHAEWTTRKIDPAGPSPWATGSRTWPGDPFRSSVAAALAGPTSPPPSSGRFPRPDNTLTAADVEWIQNAMFDTLKLYDKLRP